MREIFLFSWLGIAFDTIIGLTVPILVITFVKRLIMLTPITVSIEVPAYLKNYLLALYGPEEPIKFKNRSVYNRFLIQNTGPWPEQITKKNLVKAGNIDVILPWNMFKDPAKCNYIGWEDQKRFRAEIIADFKSDFFAFIKEKMGEGFLRKDATILFMNTYNISDSDLSFDAFYRNFNRKMAIRRIKLSLIHI